jgi:hypothetical protein
VVTRESRPQLLSVPANHRRCSCLAAGEQQRRAWRLEGSEAQRPVWAPASQPWAEVARRANGRAPLRQ